jgi:1-acyl-sn-glycerol-3-phosphate acyltransferase
MLKRLLIHIFSILYWTWFVITNIILFSIAIVIWLLTVLFDKRLVLLHQFSSLWGFSYIWLNPLWPLKMTGRKNIKWGRTYVIISNHQSMLDILVLYGLFRHYKWVSKKENFSIPIIGWLMRLNRYIELERGSTGSYLTMMKKIRQTLSDGNSILMFPEGTRNVRGGGINPFREGAFRMALENKIGLIPVVLDGTAYTIPKGKIILIGKQRLTVKILPEIPYDSFKDKTPKQLMNEVRKLMIREFEEISESHPVAEADLMTDS